MPTKLYADAVQRTNWDKHGERPSVQDFQAKGDAKRITVSVASASASISVQFNTGTGTISSTGASVIGSGTKFTQQLTVGWFIVTAGQYGRVKSIISDTELTIDGTFTPDISGVAFQCGPGFIPSDVGKRAIIYGAASSGRETFEANTPQSIALVDTYTAVGVIAVQAATKFRVGVSCAVHNAIWELFGANSSNFSGEVSVYGPRTVVPGDASDLYAVTPPIYRYYRVKAKNATAGQTANFYVTPVAWGYVLGASITFVTDGGHATLGSAAGVTRQFCQGVFGTDDTEALQTALDTIGNLVPAGTADGGMVIEVPRGQYLISAPIFHRKAVTVRGHSGGGSIIVADGAAFPSAEVMWNMTGTYPADVAAGNQPLAFFTLLEDVRLDCAHVPESIGAVCDALQENSGMRRVSVTQWHRRGIVIGGAASGDSATFNAMFVDLWIYPSAISFADSDVIGLDIQWAEAMLYRCTVTGQSGFLAGYGKAVYSNNSQIRLVRLHVEACEIGVHIDVLNQIAMLDGVSSFFNCIEGVRLSGLSPAQVRSLWAIGKYSVVDEITGNAFSDAFTESYNSGNTPQRMRGGGSGLPLYEWYAADFYGTFPAWMMDPLGNFRMGKVDFPNVIAFNAIPFGGDNQGGFLTVNSAYGGFPLWDKTTTDGSTNAMFVRLAGSAFEIRFGVPDQPTFVYTGTVNASGTGVTKATGANFDVTWPVGSQVAIGYGTASSEVGFIASVDSVSHITLQSPLGGTYTASPMGISTDHDAFGGVNPGKSAFKVTASGSQSFGPIFPQTGGSTTTPGLYVGSGSPETVVTARIGSVFLRVDGSPGTAVYMKESGTGNSGWTPIDMTIWSHVPLDVTAVQTAFRVGVGAPPPPGPQSYIAGDSLIDGDETITGLDADQIVSTDSGKKLVSTTGYADGQVPRAASGAFAAYNIDALEARVAALEAIVAAGIAPGTIDTAATPKIVTGTGGVITGAHA